MTRHTKIVATVGPACADPAILGALAAAGVDVFRLNTSHGAIAEHVAAVALARQVARETGRSIATLMDLGGPKLRIGTVDHGGALHLEAGATVELVPGEAPSSLGLIAVAYEHLLTDVRPGHRVLIDDGAVELRVESAGDGRLRCEVVYGGAVSSRKGVAFPDSRLTLRALTARDREAIVAGVAAGVDYFALSFVADAEDLRLARALIRAEGAATPIIAKIERRLALDALDEIAAEADGLMVARGDLGVEMPPEEVPVQQRRIIAAAARRMIPVITATQMLESMIQAPRPTRAESSDVAHAVWDHSDALMLSGETAAGKYPVAAVEMMDRIIRRAESFPAPADEATDVPQADDHSWVIARAARRMVESDANIRAIACFTQTGRTALLLSKVRPSVPVYAFTPDEAVCRRLALARGVTPLLVPFVETSEAMLRAVDEHLQAGRHLLAGEEVVVLASLPVSRKGTTNFIKLHQVGEAATY